MHVLRDRRCRQREFAGGGDKNSQVQVTNGLQVYANHCPQVQGNKGQQEKVMKGLQMNAKRGHGVRQMQPKTGPQRFRRCGDCQTR